jgi:hypothetical protein
MYLVLQLAAASWPVRGLTLLLGLTLLTLLFCVHTPVDAGSHYCTAQQDVARKLLVVLTAGAVQDPGRHRQRDYHTVAHLQAPGVNIPASAARHSWQYA